MKLITFNYTKADGKTSQREIIELAAPSVLLSGIDISELYCDDFEQFTQEYSTLLDKQRAEYNQLMLRFDLTNNYRQFKPECMTEIKVEHV